MNPELEKIISEVIDFVAKNTESVMAILSTAKENVGAQIEGVVFHVSNDTSNVLQASLDGGWPILVLIGALYGARTLYNQQKKGDQ
jgi:hypothetical protein